MVKKRNFLLKKFFTKELLLYSWSYIKRKNSLFLNRTKTLEPISDSWFNNVIKLILKGKYVYINNYYKNKLVLRYNYNQKVVNKLKFKILELSFLFFIKPFFNVYYFSQEVFLNGVLRELC